MAYQGEVKRSRSRRTGTTVVLFDTTKTDEFDPEGGRWVTICEEHSTVCNHETRKLAEYHMPVVDWCEECQDNLTGVDRT